VSTRTEQAADRAAEEARLVALHALRILDTPAEERFDRIARSAAALFGTRFALISLVDADRQWAKSCLGLDLREIPLEQSFCMHGLHGTEILTVPDATQDLRFEGNALVVGAPGLRFYAGAVIRSADGQPLGRLCVLDTVPREIEGLPLQALADLAAWVELELHGGAAPAPADDPAALALMQERFLTVAAHELRTPLTLIRGFSEELLDPLSGELTDHQRLSAEAVATGARRLQTLVDNLLLMLEIDAGRVHLEPEPVELAGLADEVRDELAAAAAQAQVCVEVDVAPEARVVADHRRLSHALRMLLRNAIDWSPPGGVVRVVAGAFDDGELRLTVRDEGPGLPPGEAAAVGRRDPREGAGLGLAIARGLAELHGGRLEAGEQDGDGGAVLSLVLPAPAAQPAAGGR
jgi:signal transduction histidine kinase